LKIFYFKNFKKYFYGDTIIYTSDALNLNDFSEISVNKISFENPNIKFTSSMFSFKVNLDTKYLSCESENLLEIIDF